MKSVITIVIAAFVAVISLPVWSAAPEPKITQAQAQRIATRQAAGKIVKKEYELEDGSYRYSFDFRQQGRIHEIGVDADTGKVIEDSWVRWTHRSRQNST